MLENVEVLTGSTVITEEITLPLSKASLKEHGQIRCVEVAKEDIPLTAQGRRSQCLHPRYLGTRISTGSSPDSSSTISTICIAFKTAAL
jgi:hypothetical protein